MRIVNHQGRAGLVVAGRVHDIATATGDAIGPDPDDVFRRWQEFLAAELHLDEGVPLDEAQLGAPVVAPRQVFAIGLNYAEHAAESGLAVPEEPVVFTKFPSCLTGHGQPVRLPDETVDYEAELVVIIGREARGVSAETGWDHVAGVTAGQDLSERTMQNAGPAPQFSLAKSFPGFGPIGPAVVTPDGLPDRNALRLGTVLVDERGVQQVVQDGSTADLIFDVPTLIAKLSAVVTLYPGDLVFTGTPAGVGIGREPKLYLRPGWTLRTHLEGVGELATPLV